MAELDPAVEGVFVLVAVELHGGDVFLVQRGIHVRVAHDVAGAARGHLVYVHVEPPLLAPGEQAVIVVNLGALGLVVVAHIAAATPRFPAVHLSRY